MKNLIEVLVHDIAYDGRSVGEVDGKVIFLNAGLPGERVLAEVIRRKPRYNVGRVQEIITRSKLRIQPECRHFDNCGGCAWQDLEYKQQLKYKRKQVIDCLTRLGGLEGDQVNEVIGSDDLFFYRNKMEFSFHHTPDGSFTLGLHEQGKYDEIFDLHKCHLQSELSNRLVAAVREFVATHQIPVYDVKQHTGFMRFLMIREGKNTDQVMVNLVTNIGDMPHQTELIDCLTGTDDKIKTVVHNQNGKKANVATGEIETTLYGPGYIEEQLLGFRFRIRANSFFQTNSRQAETLYKIALDLLELEKEDQLLDLYCGTGAIGILASGRVKRVLGVESVADAVTAARENADLNGCDNVQILHGDVRRVLQEDSESFREFDVVVIDPPRAGMHPKALKRIIELFPPRLLYISCNPATFARDARELVDAGYSFGSVQPVDMFPHTRHIELVTRFDRT